jgi:hypothetical protein
MNAEHRVDGITSSTPAAPPTRGAGQRPVLVDPLLATRCLVSHRAATARPPAGQRVPPSPSPAAAGFPACRSVGIAPGGGGLGIHVDRPCRAGSVLHARSACRRCTYEPR